MDKIPTDLYEDQTWQEALAGHYEQFSYRQQDKLLQKLREFKLTGESMHLLAASLNKMNEKQLDTVLQLLINNQEALLENTVPMLVDLVYHAHSLYAKKGYQTLQALNLKNRQAQKAIRDFEKNKKYEYDDHEKTTFYPNLIFVLPHDLSSAWIYPADGVCRNRIFSG